MNTEPLVVIQELKETIVRMRCMHQIELERITAALHAMFKQQLQIELANQEARIRREAFVVSRVEAQKAINAKIKGIRTSRNLPARTQVKRPRHPDTMYLN